MRADRTRIIITVMRDEGTQEWSWTSSYNPGEGKPRLTADGKRSSRAEALATALTASHQLVREVTR